MVSNHVEDERQVTTAKGLSHVRKVHAGRAQVLDSLAKTIGSCIVMFQTIA